MEKSSGGLISGFGGAAILALFLSPGAIAPPKSLPGPTTTTPAPQSQAHPSVQNDSGPWSAICREYATATDTPKSHIDGPTGTSTHTMPSAAGDPTAVEYTTHTTTKHGVKIDLRYQVKAHPIGDLGKCLKTQKDVPVEVILATIPDPVASHLPLQFDRDIEALEEAAGVSGYAISQFWLPWEASEAPSAGATDSIRSAENKAKAEQPGVLVFHAGGGSRLFIFLVGETPTTGIDRVQFAHALLYMKQVLEKTATPTRPRGSGCDEASAIRIAGPHFSGSFLGMGEILSSPKRLPENSCLEIINPESTSQPLIDDFRWALSGAQPLASGSARLLHSAPCLSGESCLVSLNLPYTSQEQATLTYLGQLGYRTESIAFLGEDESAYSAAHDAANPAADPSKATLELHYPRDLSSLRNRSDSSVSSGAEIDGVKIPLLSIPVALGEAPHCAQDTPRAFAVDQEASRNDHALETVVERLRRSQTRVLIISASNPLDTLYLLKYFQQHLPNMRFVTLEADEFEIGRPQNVDLTGTLSISDLPLLRDAIQRRHKIGNDPPSFHVVNFASSDTESTYVAASLLIGRRDSRDTRVPMADLAPTKLDQCATESVVGRTGFVSLAPETEHPAFPCLRSTETAMKYLIQAEEESPNANLPKVPRPWIGMLFVSFLITLVHLIHLLRCGAMKLNTACSRVRGWSYPAHCDEHEPKRLGLLTALNNQYLLINFAVLATSYALGGFQSKDKLAFVASVSDLVVASLCAAATVLLLWRIVQSGQLRHAWPPLLLSFPYTAAAIYMWFQVLWHYPGYQSFNVRVNALRIAMVSEGLSPLVPFLILTAAFIFYATVELYGIDWAARRHVHLEFDKTKHPNLVQFCESLAKLSKSLRPFPKGLQNRFYFAIVAILLFGLTFHVWNSLLGFEGRFFRGWLYFSGFSLLLALVTFTVLRAWSLWTQLRDILSWLQDTKLGPAFAGLHAIDLPKLRIWDLGKRQLDLSIHGRMVDSIRKLYGEDRAQKAQTALDTVRSAKTNNCSHSAAAAKTLFKELNAPMNDALTYLYREPTRYSRCGTEYQRYLALRFVALVRFTLLNIRNLYTFVFYGFASLVVCVASYPFEGKNHLGSLLTLVFVFLMVSVAVMLVQIQRNTILSLIEGSPAGQVGYADLFRHLISVGGIPALLVLATKFPSLAQFLTSWIRPGVDLMK